MFFNASNFTSNLSNWNVNNVTNMNYMFGNASKFTSNLSKWNIGKVTNMEFMFAGSKGFTVDDWDNTLIGWSANPNTPSNIIIHVYPKHSPKADSAYKNLTTNKKWTIIERTN